MNPVQNSHQVTSKFYLLLSAIVLVSGALLFPAVAQHPPAVDMYVPRLPVPDVRGRSLADAQRTLEMAGFRPGRVSVTPGPGIVGTVQRQEPVQNSTAVKGTVFDLVLVGPSESKKPDHSDENFTVQVPSLDGLTQNEASNRLEKLRLQIGSVSSRQGKGKVGTIYDQKPRAGSWVNGGAKIDVAIVQAPSNYSGAEVFVPPLYVIVPNLRGQTKDAAAEILAKYRLRLGEVSQGEASVLTGTIYGQMPTSESKVPVGTTVRIYVAGAPPKIIVKVPNLLNMDIAAARAALTQENLQLGEVSSDESDATPNSVTSQSPQADTLVERGSSVGIVVAQPIPTVDVPSLVNYEEAQAVILLGNAGLQMGSVTQQDSTANSGMVLKQNPQSGVQVRKGSNVDVVVSRQVAPQLTVMLGSANFQKGENLTFHAHLEPPEPGVTYQFRFGDGHSTNFAPSSEATYAYSSSGNFQVLAYAQIGKTTIKSEPVAILVPGLPIGLITGIVAGVLVLAITGFVLHGRSVFHRFIRVVPALDPGAQRTFMEVGAPRGYAVQVRIQQDPGIQSIYSSKKSSPRRKDPHE
jgi:beta-lactam-binding protein with PASTA domain